DDGDRMGRLALGDDRRRASGVAGRERHRADRPVGHRRDPGAAARGRGRKLDVGAPARLRARRRARPLTVPFGQRVLALAGAGLLAGVVAVVGVARDYPVGGKRSTCGWLLEPETLGIVHPVLPCGTKLFLQVGGKRVYTQVVDRGPVPSREDFDVTAALAEKINLT